MAYKPRRNTPADAKRQRKRKLRQSNVANGGFTPKVSAVIDAYFTNGFNQRDALRSVGYAESTVMKNQFSIFGRVDVKEEIERRRKEKAEAAGMDADWLMRRLKTMIEANPGDIMRKLKANGYDLDCLTDDELYVIDELVTEDEVITNADGTKTLIGAKARMKIVGRHQAIVTAMRKLGLFQDKVDVTVNGQSLIERLQAGRKRAGGDKE